jgi:hypothetical protein
VRRQIVPDVIGRNILPGQSFDAFNKNVLGPTSKIALNAIRDGKPVSELDNNGVTNGAAMRASPLGCLLPGAILMPLSMTWPRPPARRINRIWPSRARLSRWAISRAIDGAGWPAIVDALPAMRTRRRRPPPLAPRWRCVLSWR